MAAPICTRAPNIFRLFPFFIPRYRLHFGRFSQACAAQQNDVDPVQIKVPKRIKRSPTAVLEALAETVEKDSLGPNYRYIDDPALIPNDSNSKRHFSLAKASGKKAAQWIMKNYYTGFVRDRAEPTISDFNPTYATEKILKHHTDEPAVKRMLKMNWAKDAYDYYLKLKEEGKTLSPETMLQLLEQLCIFGNENKQDRIYPEDQFYFREINPNDRYKITDTWGESSPAELLFEDLPEKTPAAYRCIIRGMSKGNHAERAVELYGEMVDANIQADLPTYNAVLYAIPILREESETKWTLLEKTLKDMKENNVQPNLATFNAVLYGLSQFMNRWRRSNTVSLQVLREMKASGIEPSLGSWGCLINVFYNKDSSQVNILTEIMDHIEGKSFTCQHPTDLDFFRLAMLKCCVNLKDIELAYRIDALLNTGRNALLLGDSFSELLYYNQFFKLLCSVEDIDKVMSFYERCSPHIWSPGFSNMAELLKLLEMYEAYQYLPQIWIDLVTMDYLRREDLVESILQLMGKVKHEDTIQETIFAMAMKHVDDIKEAEESQMRFGRPLMLTGPMFGSLVQITLNSGNFNKAWELFQMFMKKKSSTIGIPSEESLKQLAEACLSNKGTDQCMMVISAISDLAYPCIQDLIPRAKAELELTDSQRQQLSLMV